MHTKEFKVTVNNTTSLNIKEQEVSHMDTVKVSGSRFHILQNNTSHTAEIVNSNFNNKTYTVKVNNTEYNVTIGNALDELIKNMGFEIGAAKKVNEIKAPMPGLILDIQVAIGQEVKEDDTLLILEAMKMENSLASPRDGIIKSISVNKGEAVDKNELLIEFE